MAYDRFSKNSKWYIWWNGGVNDDFPKGKTKDMQLLAIAHSCMNDWPLYFTYRQLTQDLGSCLFTLKMKLNLSYRRNLKTCKKCIKEFIKDVDRIFGEE